MKPAPERYRTEAPDVSIVLLHHDRSDLTEKCLGALAAHTKGHTYEIILVGGGGTDVNVDHSLDINPVGLGEYTAIEQGRNIGASHANGQYLVFLDNGVLVEPGWLQPLIGLLASNPNAGAVGSRILNPDGSVREAGAFIDKFGNAIRAGTTTAYHPDEELETRIVDYCSGVALATPRKIFHEVSGFDSRFSSAYYQDVDLGMRIAGTGRFVYHCPTATVVDSKESTSSMRSTGAESDELMEINRTKFLRRWGAWLEQRSDIRAPGNCVLELPKLITP